MTLEERIKQMLEESAKQTEVETIVEEKQVELKSISEEDLEAMTQEEFDSIDEEQLDELSKATLSSYIKKAQKSKFPVVDTASEHKFDKRVAGIVTAKDKLKESSEVSSQVSALLEAEGLSEEFKVQAVTIFEAAVTDRVLQIQEELEAQYNEKLDEATAQIEENIDGFLTAAVQEWAAHNEVAIAANFKSRLAESFMDGIQSLMAEHNIELPEDSENALEIALDQVAKLEESAEEVQTTIAQLQEQVNELKAEKILESFKEKMTSTEFDRFSQLTESVKFKDETQYEKQLTVVLENFGKQLTPKQKVVKESAPAVITETVEAPQANTVVTEQYSNVNVYAQYLASRVGKI